MDCCGVASELADSKKDYLGGILQHFVKGNGFSCPNVRLPSHAATAWAETGHRKVRHYVNDKGFVKYQKEIVSQLFLSTKSCFGMFWASAAATDTFRQENPYLLQTVQFEASNFQLNSRLKVAFRRALH